MGKLLDPTYVHKLVRVEPWSKSDRPSNATNHELSSQDVSPSPIRKSVRTSWKKPLRPVMDDGQPRLELVPPQRILVKMDADKGKIAEESIEKIDELDLLIMCVTLWLTLIKL